MAIDIHYVVDGKIKESWHVEEWLDVVTQLKDPKNVAGKTPALHAGQPMFDVKKKIPSHLDFYYNRALTTTGGKPVGFDMIE